ncbi:hypothetical protein QWZ10_23595 [Paracoccus cavernae]|uniref:Uncharacterized protein n=1 Tax=Paracoccus cavernae TaxID=1571207 RepID=A0ABT8DB62_9RHOB|nr:hypothetical protein [Paracoccus cavernae]
MTGAEPVSAPEINFHGLRETDPAQVGRKEFRLGFIREKPNPAKTGAARA